MWLLDALAERRIEAAQEAGELENLACAGQPIRLDDDRHVPEELRAGYRLLKNAGYLPPELQQLREIRSVESLIAQAQHSEQPRLRRRLARLRLALGEGRYGRVLVELSGRLDQDEG